MPLYKTLCFNPSTTILIWKITERLEDLLSEIELTENSINRLRGMKSVVQQCAFLGVRKLLQHKGYSDSDLYYDSNGKPHLKDGRHISISHSFEMAVIILSDVTVGIDLEKQREKIIRIADKFAETEFSYLNSNDILDYISRLTVIWGAKEAIFKIRNETGISFKDHITVNEFELAACHGNAILHFGPIRAGFKIYFTEIENFMLIYAFEND